MLSQPKVTTTEGQCVLLDEVLGPGFALLRFHHNPKKAFATLKTDFWERLGARFVCIQPGIPRKEGYDSMYRECSHNEANESLRIGNTPLMVVQSNDTDFLANYRDLFVVVRPDRYILGVFREEKADMFVSAFQRLLHKG
jgi:3-(3-hydroxy-phenyl)propionate hydroxylase